MCEVKCAGFTQIWAETVINLRQKKTQKRAPPSLQKAAIWEIHLKSTATFIIHLTFELTLQFTYALQAFPYYSPFPHRKTSMPMPDVEVQTMEMAGRKVSLMRKQPQVMPEEV